MYYCRSEIYPYYSLVRRSSSNKPSFVIILEQLITHTYANDLMNKIDLNFLHIYKCPTETCPIWNAIELEP